MGVVDFEKKKLLDRSELSRITFEKLTEIFKYICGLRNNETISSITKVHHFEIYGFQNLKSTLTYRFYTLEKSPLSIKKKRGKKRKQITGATRKRNSN